jgi:hypothetical protein
MHRASGAARTLEACVPGAIHLAPLIHSGLSLALKNGEMMLNPFTIRGALQRPEEFAGRAAEINDIVARLRSMQSCSVVGERRIGKSSLLYHLSQTGGPRIGDENYRFLYIEISKACSRTRWNSTTLSLITSARWSTTGDWRWSRLPNSRWKFIRWRRS